MKIIANKIVVVICLVVLIALLFVFKLAIDNRNNFILSVNKAYNNFSQEFNDRFSNNASLKSSDGKFSLKELLGFVGRKGSVLALETKEFERITKETVDIKKDFENHFPYFVLADGKEALRVLKASKDSLSSLSSLSSSFRNQASVLSSVVTPTNYLAIQTDISKRQEMIDAIQSIVSDNKKIVFLLLDDKKMNGYGGDIIGEAVFNFKNGSIDFETSQEVNWDKNVEANFFADLGFSLSSKEEAEVVLGINVSTLNALIKRNGPLELTEYKALVDENNATKIISKHGDEAFASILREMVDNLRYLSASKKIDFVKSLYSFIENKNIQVNFKDERLKSLSYNKTPLLLSDNYFSVVPLLNNKEKETVRLKTKIEIELNGDGTADSSVEVTRVSPSYLNSGMTWLLSLSPNSSVLKAVNATQSSKEVDNLKLFKYRDSEKGLVLNYAQKDLKTNSYRFIYERPSGVNVALSLNFKAPAGYIFDETKRGEYVYDNNDVLNQTIIDLNLIEL